MNLFSCTTHARASWTFRQPWLPASLPLRTLHSLGPRTQLCWLCSSCWQLPTTSHFPKDSTPLGISGPPPARTSALTPDPCIPQPAWPLCLVVQDQTPLLPRSSPCPRRAISSSPSLPPKAWTPASDLSADPAGSTQNDIKDRATSHHLHCYLPGSGASTPHPQPPQNRPAGFGPRPTSILHAVATGLLSQTNSLPCSKPSSGCRLTQSKG